MVNDQKFSVSLQDPEQSKDIYKYYEMYRPYYEYQLEDILDPQGAKKLKPVHKRDCPLSPMHPEHPDFVKGGVMDYQNDI